MSCTKWPSYVVWGSLILLAGQGCEPPQEQPEAYAARVGDLYLPQDEVEQALSILPGEQDTAQARRQYIEQWITNALLYQEAQRRALQEEANVQRRLAESERTVLVSALLDQLYEEAEAAPSQAEMQAYFEQHKEMLKLREPYVRLRYLASSNPDSAAAARRRLIEAKAAATADSLWPTIVRQYADDVQSALSLSNNYLPESQLFLNRPTVRTMLQRIGEGEIARLILEDSLSHVLQLVERIPTGTVPELAWILPELRQRLAIQNRKQMYARQVQRLRNEALARDDLEIP